MPTEAEAHLIEAATRVLASRHAHPDHTVAAAGRDADGRIFVGVNVSHFTGGPCAEMVVMGAAAAASAAPLELIVAVGDEGRGVLSPCGKCRQMLSDYFPALHVLVPGEGGPVAVPIRELLPQPYVRNAHRR
ncbi:MAG: cytidine deaminase [Mycobacterium sp.]|nr:cytidine deaminase [Mycobacterium sp.]